MFHSGYHGSQPASPPTLALLLRACLSLLRSTWLACYQLQASFLMSSVPAHKVLTWTFFNPNVYSHCNMGATYSFPPLPYCLSWTNSYLSGAEGCEPGPLAQARLPRVLSSAWAALRKWKQKALCPQPLQSIGEVQPLWVCDSRPGSFLL